MKIHISTTKKHRNIVILNIMCVCESINFRSDLVRMVICTQKLYSSLSLGLTYFIPEAEYHKRLRRVA